MSVTRTSTGLIFRDVFDRADGDAVGNGWDEKEEAAGEVVLATTAQGIDVVAKLDGEDDRAGIARNVALPTTVGDVDHILQHRGELLSGGSFTNVVSGWWGDKDNWPPPFGGGEGYGLNQSETASLLLFRNRGTTTTIASAPEFGGKRRVRAVLTADGAGGIDVDLYSDRLPNNLDEDPVLTLVDQGNDSNPSINTTGGIGFWGGRDNWQASEIFVCGRRITVTGLPTGYQAQVDNNAAITESGGTATLDAGDYVLPGTEIKILDATGTQVDSLSPSDGVWGGDEYDFSAPPDKPVITVDDVDVTTVDASGSTYNSPIGAAHSQSQWQIDEVGDNFGSPVEDVTSSSDLESHQYTSLQTETDYEIRVRYQDEFGEWSEWSDPVSVTTLSGSPDKPTISVVQTFLEGVELQGSTYSHEAGIAHASTQWQIDEQGGGFSSPVHDTGFITSDLTLIEIRGVLDQDSPYDARVRYKDTAGGVSEWSDPASFTTKKWSEDPADPTSFSDCEEPTAASYSSCDDPTASSWEQQ